MDKKYKIVETTFKDGTKKYCIYHRNWFGLWMPADLDGRGNHGIYIDTLEEAKNVMATHRNKRVNKTVYEET